MMIKFSKTALKFLQKLDKKSVERLRNAIQGLTLNPPMGDIKTLQGYSDDCKRLRVNGWRVIYRIDMNNEQSLLLILDIGNRGDVYK